MAQNNAIIIASVILADAKKTGTLLSNDKIITLCNKQGVSSDIVKQIVETAISKQESERAVDFALEAAIGIAIAKAKDIDDEDLKDATEAYIEYTEAVNKLRDKYRDEIASQIAGYQEMINNLNNPNL